MPRWLSGLIFFTTVLVLWTGLHLYVYWRLTHLLHLVPGARAALKYALPALGLLYLVGRVLEGPLGAGALALLWPGAVWMGVLSVLVTALLVYEVAFTLPVAGLKLAGWVSPEGAASAGRFALAGVAVLAVGLSAWGIHVVDRGPVVTEVEVAMPGLPRAMDGFRLVQASDIHVGGIVGPAYLEKIASVVDGLDADLVVLTGDLTDENDGGDGSAFERLARLKSRHGVVASTGNHEYYVGAQAVVKLLESRGIPVIRQGFRLVADGLVVAGVDDPSFLGGRGALGAAISTSLAGRPAGLPVVLLSHQPLAIGEAADAGVSLMLSGHTHGGQLPPFQVLTGLAFPVLEGLHRVGNMTLYVSRGAGYWGPPMRIFAPPEVTRFTLRSPG